MQIAEEYSELNSLKQQWMPWLVCFAATLFFFYEFIQGNMFASIAEQLMRDYRIEVDKMAFLSSIYYISNVLFLFVAGIILDRFSIKKTILFAMVLCVIGTLILANTHSYQLALICRFITGIGSAFCFLGPVRLASQWFPPQRMALVTGFIVTIAMTGGMLAQYPLTTLVTHVGWRAAVQDVGLFGIFILVLMILWIKEKPTDKPVPTAINISISSAARTAYLNLRNLRAALFTSLMNMPIAVLGAMIGTLYLKQRLGLSADKASVINSALFLGTIIGGPLIGHLSDKIRLRILPMKIAALASLTVMLMIVYLPPSFNSMLILFFLLGFLTSAQVISYAFVAENSPPELTATAVSVVSILTQGGFIVYQILFSHLLTSHGDVQILSDNPIYSQAAYQYALMLLPLGLLLALAVLLGLKDKKLPKDQVKND